MDTSLVEAVVVVNLVVPQLEELVAVALVVRVLELLLVLDLML